MAKVANKAQVDVCKALPWDEFVINAGKGISRAIKTSQGIAFAVTQENDLVFMSDADSFYSANELAGTFKKYGNHSDFADSHIVTTVLDIDLNKTPEEVMRDEIMGTPQRYASLPSNITAILNGVNWAAVADELIPMLKAVQDIFEIKEIKMC